MIFENLKNKRIILASKSPRRKNLLKATDIDFSIINSKEIDETVPENLINEHAAVYLAEHKANAYKNDLRDNEILIAADTIVCLNRKILGKPTDFKDAFSMIKSLSGKKHKVITGVSVISKKKSSSFSSTSIVWFKDIPDEEIIYYINTYKPYDKAGAYGIQEWIGLTCIEKIEGSYFNVMGLPVQKLYETLKEF